MSNSKAIIGIDDMAFYVPKVYFDLQDLAEARGIVYAKLNKGLGLTHMAVTDAHEDAATMAANAVLELMLKNDLKPSEIGRIYLGTESALDGAKPTATYALQMLQDKFSAEYGPKCFSRCDVVDLTFACIGGVDAMQNTLDWVNGKEGRIGIVVCTDNARYELGSSGEYTQGAGAVALLIKSNPRLMALNNTWGVSTMGVHDFFKPVRRVSKSEVLKEMFQLLGSDKSEEDLGLMLDKLHETIEVKGVLDSNEPELCLHKITPVFDGQFSNQCYQDRIGDAFDHYKEQRIEEGSLTKESTVIENWERIVFHLPYAFHGKRVFQQVFLNDLLASGGASKFLAANNLVQPKLESFSEPKAYAMEIAMFLKAVSKTPEYLALVSSKIEKGQRASSYAGNLYTASIFLSLMSVFESDLEEGAELTNRKFGFFAYGSGSKSKVFEGEVQEGWKEVVKGFNVFSKLKDRKGVDYATYEALHKGMVSGSVNAISNEFALNAIENTPGDQYGARYYKWQ